MPEGLKKLLEPFLALSTAKRLVVGGVALASLLGFAALIAVANKTDYRPLFANLTQEDAGEIVKKLKEQKVPYQISPDGKAILVPSDNVYDLRLSLASDGLPQGGGVGFEIFDRKNFGMTEFVQKLNYQRALQGELGRTIAQIAGVESARVHLALPEKALFKDQEKPATASVVLKMKSNRQLREGEVQGIVHLVASSIEGMDPEQVTVLDTRGKVLSSHSPNDPTSKVAGARQDTQRAFEKTEEEKLQSLLDRVVGSGKSVARVSASFDFKQVEKYEERYDPESAAVRSEQRSEEKGGGSSTASGVPGVQSNMGRAQGAAGSTTGGGSKTDETLNYEVSRSTARIIEPVGSLSKVSVAILVDGKYELSPGAKPGATPKYQPRSPDEMQKIESLVKSAVGFNAERGDQVTVANIPFQETGDQGGEQPSWYDAPIVQTLIKNGLIGLAFLALLFYVIRPLMKMLKIEKAAHHFLPIQDDVEQQQMLEMQKVEHEKMRVTQLELVEKVKQDPYQAAQILQNWLTRKD
ncbi:flagellar M-ring mounting plate protein FliF [Citrifermentans bemidjiense Bem]|uniref:Flagellar M-ring protein n=1 Tax=Citrifermentans bemidjiense (strain ATCC BAA-1014 / DSM 16622 / JCM 12645 / Bem) TaxID=404380 RepID=B5EEP4_CITBB|nr:flagellar basal-body MS-ring/collar protein FliF [Citrifermentans bemidjiense]ACH40830.1 flagellar M-ring mounting plate protein FliF [Citrifermentans bemidjiense Bem]